MSDKWRYYRGCLSAQLFCMLEQNGEYLLSEMHVLLRNLRVPCATAS